MANNSLTCHTTNEKRLICKDCDHYLVCKWAYNERKECSAYKPYTVDAVEVVRCKDCKHWEKCESSLVGDVMCCTGQGSMYIQKAENDFCSKGERREGE